jgi:hypothetical protein
VDADYATFFGLSSRIAHATDMRPDGDFCAMGRG